MIVNGASAIVGSYGASISNGYVIDCTPSCESKYNVRFYFDPNSITIPDYESITIFKALKLSTVVIKVDIYFVNGSYKVRCYALDDTMYWRTTAWYNISDSAHYFEFNWEQAQSKNIKDGSLYFWVDGHLRLAIVDLDNDKICIDTAYLGVMDIATGVSGSCFFDAYESRRVTHIGSEGGLLGSSSASPSSSISPSPSVSISPSPSSSPSSVTDLIFEDDFNSGSLAAWTSSTGGPGDIFVAGNKLQVNVNGASNFYALDSSPSGERRYRARFYFDPNSIAMSNYDTYKIFVAYHGSGESAIIEFRYIDWEYQIRYSSKIETYPNWITSSWIAIIDTLTCIEIDFSSASSKNVNDGFAVLYIDGVVKFAMSGLNNDTIRVDEIRLGMISSGLPSSVGSVIFDDFKSNRVSYIGL